MQIKGTPLCHAQKQNKFLKPKIFVRVPFGIFFEPSTLSPSGVPFYAYHKWNVIELSFKEHHQTKQIQLDQIDGYKFFVTL